MAEECIEYWIWLQQALGVGSPKPDRLVREFGSVSEVYNARRVDLLRTGFLTEKEILKLTNKSLEKSEKIVSDCMKKGYKILSRDELPQRLQNIYAPPCVLYVWGSIPEPQDGVFIAMVGTRNVTPYGVEAATKLSVGLARCGVIVVSGMALGVDTASHRGALKGGGKTVAVIGCGIDIDYPASNRELKRLIAQNGAVVSEYPPGTRADRANFPVRNRIIAGLSLGCVVVEAGSRSGALITASLAAEMGRDVFAVPGSIFSPASDGTNKLLRDGVKPVCSVMDILEEYIGICPQSVISKITQTNTIDKDPEQLGFEIVKKEKKISGNSVSTVQKPGFSDMPADEPVFLPSDKGNRIKTEFPRRTQVQMEHDKISSVSSMTSAASADKRKAVENNFSVDVDVKGLSKKQLMVYNVLTEKPKHVDDIALEANLELRTVLAVLTTLEIEGYVRTFPGGRYASVK